jgi:hypothetical protein
MQPNASAKASRPILAERQDIDKHSWRLRHLSHSHPWCYKCLVGVREGVRMRRLALFFGLGALLAAPPGAADAASDLSLTVYNSDLALVQDVRQLDAPAGRTRLEFRDVSASIRPETVTLSGDGLAIVEQNFDYDLLTPAKMMEKAVGKQIKIVRTMPGTGRETTESATVLSVNDGVILKIGNRIEVLRDDGIPTRVIFDSIPANLRASPTLSVTVDASSTGPRDVTLSYLTTGLSWKADYVALFDEEKGALRLQGWITLTNNSGTTFDNARTQLVAGDINLTGTQAQNWQRQQAQSTFNGGTNSAGQGSVADYLLYSLPERVTIAENQTKQVGFIELHDVKSSKSYDVWADSFSSSTNPIHASSVLKFSNDQKALPAGTVRVYMHDDAGESKFVGENRLDHTPSGSLISIPIGEAFDVTAQPTLVSSEKIDDSHTRYAMSYLFRNAQPKPVTVNLRQRGLRRDGKVDAESIPSRRIDANTLGWTISVPANGETALTFTVDAGD